MLAFQMFAKRFALGIIGVGVSLGLSLTPVMAKDITIQVWAGGSNINDSYRVDAISMAADILEKEAAILGEDLNITVETKYDFDGWGGFKQAVTLAAEANKAPHIVVTGHEDIAP
ncbi:MAG TPA: ABC transporter substrate-binding protein, partial [Deltaproteobacteria bacterium]|nr:ABC transporter substrate-binding protein [Deltaproteobacteria bacterium]